jgi:hypothetical protein
MLIKEDYHINLYEITEEKKYKLLDKINYSDGIIDFTMLSNEMIITSGRHTIIIYKKDKNSSYKINQKIFNSNWAKIYRIKELENKNLAVCGWIGFIIFEMKENNQYEIILKNTGNENDNFYRIYDFMEINGKVNNYILLSDNHALIIKGNDIIKIIDLEDNNHKFFFSKGFMCQLNNALFVLSGVQYITLFNANTNQIKKSDFLKENDYDIRRKKITNSCPNLFKFNSNSIILFAYEGIFIINIIQEEKIQVQLSISLNLYYFSNQYFNEEENSIYFSENNFWKKLKFKNKYFN